MGVFILSIVKYTAFLKVVEYQSLTKAADALGYTQPGISHMILSLEKELGLQLLLRRKDGVFPTEASENLLHYMRQIVENDRKLKETASQLCGLEIGSLNVGCFHSMSVQWLPSIIRQYLEQHPGIHISIHEGVHSDLSKWLLDGTVDLALMSLPVPENIGFIPLTKDPILAVVPRDHPLAQHPTVPVDELLNYPFISPIKGADEDVWLVLNGEKRKPDIRFRIKGDQSIIAMIGKGLGVSLLPQLTLGQLPETVVAQKLEWPHFRSLGIAVNPRTYSSPAAKAWIELAEQCILSTAHN